MGLLDIRPTDEDQRNARNVGLLGLAAGLLQPSGYRGVGAQLSQGIQGGLNGYAGAMEGAQADKLNQMKAQYMGLQADKAQLDIDQERQAIERKRQYEAALRGFVPQPQAGGAGTAGTGSVPGGGNATHELVQRRFALADHLESQGLMDEADAVRKAAKAWMPEVHGTRVGMQNGRPVNITTFKDGSEQTSGFDVAPKTHWVDAGGRVLGVNEYDPAGRPVASLGKDMSPGDAAADRRQQAESGGYEYKQDAQGNWIALPKRPVGNGPIQPLQVAGPNKQQQGSREALAIIDQADRLLGKATNSYFGRGLDHGARAFGFSMEGDNAAAQLKALEGALILKQPRMEGPQSDKDAALYRQMAGQIGDATIPAKVRRSALGVIRQLHERYAGQAEGLPAAGPAKPSVPPAPAKGQGGSFPGGYNGGSRAEADRQRAAVLEQEWADPSLTQASRAALAKERATLARSQGGGSGGGEAPQEAPRSKIVKLEGGGSAAATRGPDGHYYVERGGKRYRVEG